MPGVIGSGLLLIIVSGGAVQQGVLPITGTPPKYFQLGHTAAANPAHVVPSEAF